MDLKAKMKGSKHMGSACNAKSCKYNFFFFSGGWKSPAQMLFFYLGSKDRLVEELRLEKTSKIKYNH